MLCVWGRGEVSKGMGEERSLVLHYTVHVFLTALDFSGCSFADNSF